MINTPLVLANDITPLMFATMFHLLLGNIVIGVVEGLVISFLFDRSHWLRFPLLMILANYVSALLGLFLLHVGKDFAFPQLTINNVGLFLGVALVWAFVMSVAIEWPFVFWAFKGKRFRVSVGACLLAQAVSYVLLLAFYAPSSWMTVYTRTQVRPVETFARPDIAWVYYIDETGKNVYRIRPSGKTKERVGEILESVQDKFPSASVLAIHNLLGESEWSLVYAFNGDLAWKLLINRFVVGTVPEWRSQQWKNWTKQWSAWNWRVLVVDLRPQSERAWLVRPRDDRLYSGLRAQNQSLGRSMILNMETLILEWPSSHVTVLPGDQVVYQLGDQIVLLDLPSQTIGLVTLGQSPLVVLDEDLVDPTVAPPKD
ncbi:MAG: hypothetical protein IT443_03855 [Phycisphaeraceae bacterium]|nr:hypothetical protein [Phycisphaeraceae bacterium]